MIPPQSGPGELRGSQWSVCPAASNTPGLHIYGLYMYNNYFHIYSVHSHLHDALCRPVMIIGNNKLALSPFNIGADAIIYNQSSWGNIQQPRVCYPADDANLCKKSFCWRKLHSGPNWRHNLYLASEDKTDDYGERSCMERLSKHPGPSSARIFSTSEIRGPYIQRQLSTNYN